MAYDRNNDMSKQTWWRRHGLTGLQKRFVEEYCGPANFNASKAARDAGYSEEGCNTAGHRCLQTPKVQAAINEWLSVESMTASEATKRLTEWGRGNMALFLKKEDGEWVVDLGLQTARDNMALVKKVTQRVKRRDSPEGEIFEVRTEIELHDAKDAVDKIAKAHGVYKEQIEISGPGGQPIKSEVVHTGLTAEDALEVAKLLEELGGLDPTKYEDG